MGIWFGTVRYKTGALRAVDAQIDGKINNLSTTARIGPRKI